MLKSFETVVLERISNWYINFKTFPITEEQLINLVKSLRKPYRPKIARYKRYRIDYKPTPVDQLIDHLLKVTA